MTMNLNFSPCYKQKIKQIWTRLLKFHSTQGKIVKNNKKNHRSFTAHKEKSYK